MRLPLLIFLVLLPLASIPAASAAPSCAPANGQVQTVCAGNAHQACGGPSAYGDGWDGFTGVWGQTNNSSANNVEFGAGGWDRCYPDDWAAGAFVNMDHFPAGSYQTVQARFDSSPHSARPCYVSAGVYGYRTSSYAYGCPDEDEVPLPIPNPGWGG